MIMADWFIIILIILLRQPRLFMMEKQGWN